MPTSARFRDGKPAPYGFYLTLCVTVGADAHIRPHLRSATTSSTASAVPLPHKGKAWQSQCVVVGAIHESPKPRDGKPVPYEFFPSPCVTHKKRL